MKICIFLILCIINCQQQIVATVHTNPPLISNTTPDTVLQNPGDYKYDEKTHTWTYKPQQYNQNNENRNYGQTYTYYPSSHYTQGTRRKRKYI